MNALLLLILFNATILIFAFKTKIGLYTITPEQQWKKEIDEFDNNLKSIENIETFNYKLGSGHLYE